MSDMEFCLGGPLQVHNYDYYGIECIWCGPNYLAKRSGRWDVRPDGELAWRVDYA